MARRRTRSREVDVRGRVIVVDARDYNWVSKKDLFMIPAEADGWYIEYVGVIVKEVGYRTSTTLAREIVAKAAGDVEGVVRYRNGDRSDLRRKNLVVRPTSDYYDRALLK